MPDELKAELSKIFGFVRDGHSVEEACRLANEEMQWRRELMAKLVAPCGPQPASAAPATPEAELPAAAPAPPAAPSRPRHPERGPRIRSL